jgi:hypothetical protein
MTAATQNDPSFVFGGRKNFGQFLVQSQKEFPCILLGNPFFIEKENNLPNLPNLPFGSGVFTWR